MFQLIKTSKKSFARLGRLKTSHGSVETPFFMPCATQGAVKTVSAEEIKKLGARILLANTYHLMLRPGGKLIKRAGGLHKFISWQRPILTDSGGFQVFSLAGGKKKNGQNLVKLTRNGVRFKSYIDGKEHYLTPEKALKIQADLGVDIAVCLDVCVKLPAVKEDLKNAVELTTYWAKKTKKYFEKRFNSSLPLLLKQEEGTREKSVVASPPLRLEEGKGGVEKRYIGGLKRSNRPFLLFAVIQGGLDKKLRLKSLRELANIGWDGYNIGGLSVGETAEEMYKVLDGLVPEMPADKPRYLMGVGYPENIVEAVRRGVDMFDCVIPTREGRHGRLFLWNKNYKLQIIRPRRTSLGLANNFYRTINVNRSKFTNDFSPINENSKIPELRQYSLSYLHHLFKIKEPLGARLASLNNLEFYLDLMESIKYNINNNKL